MKKVIILHGIRILEEIRDKMDKMIIRGKEKLTVDKMLEKNIEKLNECIVNGTDMNDGTILFPNNSYLKSEIKKKIENIIKCLKKNEDKTMGDSKVSLKFWGKQLKYFIKINKKKWDVE